MCVCVCVCARARARTDPCTHTHTHTHTHCNIYIYIYMHAHTHTHAHTRTRTHANTHTHTHVPDSSAYIAGCQCSGDVLHQSRTNEIAGYMNKITGAVPKRRSRCCLKKKSQNQRRCSQEKVEVWPAANANSLREIAPHDVTCQTATHHGT